MAMFNVSETDGMFTWLLLNDQNVIIAQGIQVHESMDECLRQIMQVRAAITSGASVYAYQRIDEQAHLQEAKKTPPKRKRPAMASDKPPVVHEGDGTTPKTETEVKHGDVPAPEVPPMTSEPSMSPLGPHVQ